MSDSVRADKWLWATRFFKTRGLAADACAAGKVKRLFHPLKASSSVHAGDLLEIPFPEGPGARTILVKSLISQRVAAPLAQVCYEDQTPLEVQARQAEWHAAKAAAAKGRPTKKNRREIDRIHRFWDRPPETY